MVEEYIEQFRSDSPGLSKSSLLFPSRTGARKRSAEFWKMITDAGRLAEVPTAIRYARERIEDAIKVVVQIREN